MPGSRGAVCGCESPGVAVRSGVPKPDISTVEAYKAALLAAKSIGYSRGCSGTHAAQGIEKLGLAETLKPKTKFTVDGPVVDYLARGEFDLGIQQHNIMVGVPGTEFGRGAARRTCHGQSPARRASRWMSSSKEPEAARAFIRFIASPAASCASLLRKTHVEPAEALTPWKLRKTAAPTSDGGAARQLRAGCRGPVWFRNGAIKTIDAPYGPRAGYPV